MLKGVRQTNLEDNVFAEDMLNTRNLVFGLVLGKLGRLRAVDDSAVRCQLWHLCQLLCKG
jgi:hypothetical protein